ncbi:outer membrane protein assembly factor BamB [Hydrogenophaga sp.]|uniref:outer membrane protein assembly factor BamB n=1 Tax=Hydrogenophaga sp. TaxID=1904254 RepID=UPI0027231EC0|nr:outer membrane protein assembly factor BamB [Hydrogenophaga sp.]MDO9434096.1 outer membrane protein assembly factor BamB [Hydrogenophaga sp.]
MNRALSLLATALLVAACSSSPKKPQPTPLAPAAALMGTQLAWSAQVGKSGVSMVPLVAAGRVFVAGDAGVVAALDAATGKDVWRLNLGTPLAAGVGSDGQTAAVITSRNQLVAIVDGQERWRVRLPARSFTAPLVAGERVFVLSADRVVLAFDGKTGARLWTQSRPAEPLVLSQTGALLAVGDTLVAGLAGRLSGLNPDTGVVRWESPVATARGTNEVERLVDVVGPVSRIGSSVCARAYSAAVGCVDASRGATVWTRAAQGTTGVHGDDRLVFGSEADGRVQAWQRSTGEPAWSIDRLKYRSLSAPLALGRVVALGDGSGTVHLISREDGSEMTRLTTDGSAILAAPVLAGDALVVQTRNGGVFAWRPQ